MANGINSSYDEDGWVHSSSDESVNNYQKL